MKCGGADAHRHLSLLAELVDRDDLARAADPRALDDRQADPAAAIDRDGLPGLEPGAAQRRADPGQHAAADQRRLVERDVGVDAHDRVLVQQHLLGVGRDVDELAHRLAAQRQARGLALLAGDDAVAAHIGMAREALRAGAAEPREAGDDMVADAHGGHLAADRLDHPGALVAQDDRPVERPAADPIDDVKVAVADAGRDRAHQHLARHRLVEVDLFDGQGLVRLPEHRGLDLHGFSSRRRIEASCYTSRRCQGRESHAERA